MLPGRFRLSDLFVLVAIVAVASTVYQIYWGATFFNARIVFAVFLGSVTTAGIGTLFADVKWRPFWGSYCAFGIAYLATVLRGGYGLVPDARADTFMKYSSLGIFLGLAFGLLSHIAFRTKKEVM